MKDEANSGARLGARAREIASRLRNRELVVLCGAGISRDSGMPLAWEQKDHLVGKLPFAAERLFGIDKQRLLSALPDCSPDDLARFFENPASEKLIFRRAFPELLADARLENDARELWRSLFGSTLYGKLIQALPFEAFWERLSHVHALDEALGLYSLGVPNRNHRILARLAARGSLPAIYTTNFDLLLERAFGDETLRFSVFRSEKDFAKLDVRQDDFGLIKLHGSADEPDSIRTTIERIAQRGLAERRERAVRELFGGGSHRSVLVLGYSWSDAFDLNPLVASLGRSDKYLYWVDHASAGFRERALNGRSEMPALADWTGIRLECNTGRLLEAVAGELGISVPETPPGTLAWRECLDGWLRSAEEASSKSLSLNLMAGELASGVSDLATASGCFLAALHASLEEERFEAAYLASSGAASAFAQTGSLDRARDFYTAALSYAKAADNRLFFSSALLNLGRLEHRRGRYAEALSLYREAASTLLDEGPPVLRIVCLRYIGETLCRNGRFNEAADYIQRALAVAESAGCKQEEASCLSSLGNCWMETEQRAKAAEALERSLELNRKLGNGHAEAVVCLGLGMNCRQAEDIEGALGYQNRALRIFSEIGDLLETGRCHTNLGNLYRILRQYENARSHHSAAQDIAERTGNQTLRAMVALNRGVLLADLGNRAASIEQYQLAADLFGSSGNLREQAKSIRGIGASLLDLGRLAEARDRYLRAKNLFNEINLHHEVIDCERNIRAIQAKIEAGKTSAIGKD